MREQLHTFLVEHPVGLLFLVIGIGYLVGRIRLGSFDVGSVTSATSDSIFRPELGVAEHQKSRRMKTRTSTLIARGANVVINGRTSGGEGEDRMLFSRQKEVFSCVDQTQSPWLLAYSPWALSLA